MNYPLWDLPASGLLIALVGIIHVFISHFAVGGGLFLVVTEARARRDHDAALLDYTKRHTRFFVLLTLVMGAITGVGIWFTIGLVHPQATSSLINTFVWFWAIEWTFFVIEIAAALVYYYGWERLGARQHLAVGWIYFGAAWVSLVVITGILAYMLTPGRWVVSRNVWNGFLNPTYLPMVAARTFAAIGLAGLYALFTVSWSRDAALKAKIARYAGLGWVLPMAIALPLSLAWYLSAAGGAGVPVSEILGAPGRGVASMLRAVAVGGTASGHPIAQRAALACLVSSAAALALTLLIATARRRSFGRPLAAALMLCGLVAVGSGEWTREDLRKPYVIGQFMFVNGVRLPAPPGVATPSAEALSRFGPDPFTVDALNAHGVLASSRWARKPTAFLPAEERVAAEGREVFRAVCSSCHTTDGYLAIRPLVAGRSASAVYAMLPQLAEPVSRVGQAASWSDADLHLRTFRNRRMPPFVGTDAERQAVALYLARLGGGDPRLKTGAATGAAGVRYFTDTCSACHGPSADWPMQAKGRSAGQFYEMLGRLPAINEMMPAFSGTDAERTAVAAYLATLGSARARTEGLR
jgi:mono/diheme cytochrome c family protein